MPVENGDEFWRVKRNLALYNCRGPSSRQSGTSPDAAVHVVEPDTGYGHQKIKEQLRRTKKNVRRP